MPARTTGFVPLEGVLWVVSAPGSAAPGRNRAADQGFPRARNAELGATMEALLQRRSP